MKNFKIIITFSTILMILLGLSSYVNADSEVNTFLELTSNKTQIEKGEEFEVTIRSKQAIDIGILTGKITFDKNQFNFTEEAEDVISTEISSKLVTFDINPETSVFSGIIYQELENQETICTIKFTAKKNISLKKDSIILEDLELIDNGYNRNTLPPVELSIPQEKQFNKVATIAISVFVGLVILITSISIVFIKKNRKNN